jgi:hypothetical protein
MCDFILAVSGANAEECLSTEQAGALIRLVDCACHKRN